MSRGWNNRDNDCFVAPIFAEIRELIFSFSSFVIQHVIRAANGHAHLCAKRASMLNVIESWLATTPSFLISSLLTDCSANAFVE